METLLFFFKGLGAGFVVAAPVGPVAVLCVRRTLAHGALAGYVTGLGAAIADTLYGIVAAYGVSFIANLLLEQNFWFRLIGGALLVAVGIKMFLTGPAEARVSSHEGLFGDFLSALVLTGTNPMTVVAFGVVFTSIGVAEAGDAVDWAEALIAGVFVGSALWWGLLTALAGPFHAVVGVPGLRWVNRIAAGVILGFGVIVLIGAIAPESGIARLFDLPFA